MGIVAFLKYNRYSLYNYNNYNTIGKLNIDLICELKRALYGIKCVLRIFLTNMAEHIVDEKKFYVL